MCRSRNERDGGKRCPKEANPEAKAARNAKRREAYQLKKLSSPQPSAIPSLTEEELRLEDKLRAMEAESATARAVLLRAEGQAGWAGAEYGFLSPSETRIVALDETEVYKESEEELSGLYPAQRKALHTFTTDEFTEINGALFGKRTLSEKSLYGPDYPGALPGFLKIVDDMDEAFMSSPLRERIVYRGKSNMGARVTSLGSVEDYVKENYALGSTISFDGYQSSSLSPKVAMHYAFDNGIVFEMNSKSGINVSSESSYEDEYEVLLPRSTQWKVVAVQTGVYKLFMENSFNSYETSFKNVTVVQMVEVDEDGFELTERKAPPELTKEQLATRG